MDVAVADDAATMRTGNRYMPNNIDALSVHHALGHHDPT
jgi:hypothetical protein